MSKLRVIFFFYRNTFFGICLEKLLFHLSNCISLPRQENRNRNFWWKILGWQHKMSMSCGIFVHFFKCEIVKYWCRANLDPLSQALCIADRGGYQATRRRLRNKCEDDYGLGYLRNWLILVVAVASWILYVVNERKINSLKCCVLHG
jgi:hypothetical protein